ncbi:hypothetical protein [Bacillus subtilis]|uniref:hypothetical protein n=1 Tax=Bacillus subtilis TaxID=1423 RepID=UPI001BCF8CEA|nr:hypothetical protein [Bacillus subtilis]
MSGPADSGRKYGQASAVPCRLIQDLQEGASGAPGMDAKSRPTMAVNMAKHVGYSQDSG